MTGALAATEPWWEPGTRHAYHTNTYGHLVGEVVRRVSGETVRQRLAAMTGPLGADVHVGVPAGEERRCAEVLFVARGADDGGTVPDVSALEGDQLHGDAELLQPTRVLLHGRREHGRVAGRRGAVDQRARHGAWCGARVRRTAPARSASCRPICCRRRSRRSRRATARSSTRRSRSVSASSRRCRAAPSARTRAASVTSAPEVPSVSPIPTRGVAFGYVMNHVIPRWQSTRNRALIDAVYAVL